MIGRRLRLLREAKNLTQIELGKLIGVSNSTVSLYESGDREPDFETFKRISIFFNTSTDYLLGLTDKQDSLDVIPEMERKKAEIKKAITKIASHDDGEFPIEDDFIDIIYDRMEKLKEYHNKKKGE
jgi:transcriptional regulator with XRE-family HTH domain